MKLTTTRQLVTAEINNYDGEIVHTLRGVKVTTFLGLFHLRTHDVAYCTDGAAAQQIATDYRKYGVFIAPDSDDHLAVHVLSNAGIETVCSCGGSHFVPHDAKTAGGSRALRRALTAHAHHIDYECGRVVDLPSRSKPG